MSSGEPVFPEDIERTVNEVLLKETRGMCGAMSLVAFRFYTWTQPIAFHTVVIRPRKNWVQRVNDWLLPNAHLIQVLVVALPNIVGAGAQGRCSGEEVAAIGRLLHAAKRVKHLAVTWSIWAHLGHECGAIPVESLYLMWDGAIYDRVSPPHLDHLQHPFALKDLTVHAPRDLRGFSWFHEVPIAENYFPQTTHCPNLTSVAYAAQHLPGMVNVGRDHTQGSMFIYVPAPRVLTTEEEDKRIKQEKERYPNFSTAYVGSLEELLEGWVAKVEGRPSILAHPSLRVA
ncbi:hypothetical protein C8R46DRAFT_1214724 [Mycena filopes]|nr:hypothetical protein C8R46DRAFT_1214724 [Mycena filopes]